MPQNLNANQLTPAILIRPIEPRDDSAMARKMSEQLRELGAASVPDFYLLPLSEIYAASRCAYFVVEHDTLIVGGAGIAPLPGGFGHIAQLQRFVLSPMCGQRAHARRLLDHCLDAAGALGFRACYIESSSAASEMHDLLRIAGFQRLSKALRDPTNAGCDTFHFLTLNPS